jgi:hypothetical protein
LLYHQAVFASRESAQLEEEIKTLRKREEMRECTFKPKLLPASRRASSTPASQPRNFDATVARMRNAHQRRLQHREEVEHIPCGENYEKLRRLGTQPFTFHSKDKARTPRQTPLMHIHVNVGHGRTGRISIREGDNLHQLAQNFARTFQLDLDMALQLEESLNEAYIARIHGAASRPASPLRSGSVKQEQLPSSGSPPRHRHSPRHRIEAHSPLDAHTLELVESTTAEAPMIETSFAAPL